MLKKLRGIFAVLKKTVLQIAGPNVFEIIHGVSNANGARLSRIHGMDYDEYWLIRPENDMQPRFPIIADSIEKGSRVLDIGCGDGACLAYLKQTKNVTELGIDISKVAVERARLRNVNARVQMLSELFSIVEPASYDYVIMSEVIEHVENPEEYVVTAYDLAAKQLILTVPNIAYWPHRLRLILGRFPVQWVYHPGEHLRYWSASDFNDWIVDLLKDKKVTGLSFVSSNGITWINAHKRWPNLFGNQIVVIVSK